jgi:hypothetical protein
VGVIGEKETAKKRRSCDMEQDIGMDNNRHMMMMREKDKVIDVRGAMTSLLFFGCCFSSILVYRNGVGIKT